MFELIGETFVAFIAVLIILLNIIAILDILQSSRKNPEQLVFVLIVSLLPVFGVIIYVFCKSKYLNELQIFNKIKLLNFTKKSR